MGINRRGLPLSNDCEELCTPIVDENAFHTSTADMLESTHSLFEHNVASFKNENAMNEYFDKRRSEQEEQDRDK